MGVLVTVSTVLFVILCVLLVIVILLQSDKSAGMGILGGSSSSAFGSSTADVITKVTAVMIGLFMVGSLGLAVAESTKTVSLKKQTGAEGAAEDGTLDKGKDEKKGAAEEKTGEVEEGLKTGEAATEEAATEKTEGAAEEKPAAEE
ncbi:MAG: preprotein translocase subunit SecG [bacterium]|nr:preprotein translocase subunit SecG [bacterium]